MNTTKILAHRGASGYTPENTISSFKKALELGFDGIELDVHLSKDGHLIVMHDEKVDRTTNGKGSILSYTLKELKELDAGSWFDTKFKGEKIPTLNEVLELIKGKDILLNVEIKAGYRYYAAIEEKLLSLLEKYNYLDKSIISSFDHYSLVRLKELNSEVKTGLLYTAALYEPWDYARKVKVNALHPYYITLTPEFIKSAFENNLQINTYTVNHEPTVKKLMEAGINGVISNFKFGDG